MPASEGKGSTPAPIPQLEHLVLLEGRHFFLDIPSAVMYIAARHNGTQDHQRRMTGETMKINKDLIAASSTPLVLAILSEKDSYGYAILKRVQELSGGRMEWTDGMLYPVLHRLERLGYIRARWEVAESGRLRKYYGITPQGLAQLSEERKQWEAVEETLRGIWSALAIPPPASRPTSATPLPEGI